MPDVIQKINALCLSLRGPVRHMFKPKENRPLGECCVHCSFLSPGLLVFCCTATVGMLFVSQMEVWLAQTT